MENPVYYVQYAHARIAVDRPQGRGRRASQRAAARRRRPRAARARTRGRAAARARATIPTSSPKRPSCAAPQKVSTWVRDFAAEFHGFYRDCRVISDDAGLTQARLWLTEACRIGLADALGLLGVHAPDEMARLDDDDDDADDARDAPFDLSLLPASARVDATAAVDRRRRPRRRSRPSSAHRCFVYDEDELRRRCRAYARSFGGGVAYASKAFLCTAMARLVARRRAAPRRRDRRRAARRAQRGLPGRAHRVPRQQQVDGRAARRARRRRRRGSSSTRATSSTGCDELVGATDCPAAVLVRVTPGVEAHTHEHIETGTEDSKFGFGLDSGDALAAVQRSRRRAARLRFAGFHCHIGSQVFRLDSFERAVDKMVGLVAAVETDDRRDGRGAEPRRRARRALPRRRRCADDRRSTPRRCRSRSRKALADAGVASRPALHGRARAGRSPRPRGITLYRVGTIKAIAGVRTYVAVDGGMSDNLRPGALRRGLRGVPARGVRRATRAGRDDRGQALRAGRHRRARRAPARRRARRRRPGDARHRRLRAGRWRPTTTRSAARPSCSSATARRASSCAGKTSTTSSASTRSGR